MSFDYSEYYRANCVEPLQHLLFFLVVVVAALVYFFISQQRKMLVGWLGLALFIYMIASCVSSNNIQLSRGGIYLLKEKETDTIQIEGTVEDAFLIQPAVSRGRYNVAGAHGEEMAVVIKGETYYLMSFGEIQIGNSVSLLVLPKSHFVLHMESRAR